MSESEIMINPKKSNLYKLSSKKYLIKLLKIPNKEYLKQNYVVKQINPYIAANRLIEAPSESLKSIQRIIKNELNKIEVPDNVFSGVKGRSYIQNTKRHCRNQFLFKIDLTAFFPCITRETVYNFYLNILKTTPDIAKILTNFTTVDLSLCEIVDPKPIEKFLLHKGIETPNHLISGSPTSQILSYLVNYQMFDELQRFCNNVGITMSIYVDDITFSSQNKISYKYKDIIYKIISKNYYRLSYNKVKYYTNNYPKLVTGAIISTDGSIKIRNSLSQKVIKELSYYKEHPEDNHSLKKLRGLVIAARQCEPNKYESIYKLIFNTRITP